MYRLRDLKNGKYQIHVSKGPAFEGDRKSILKKCLAIGIRVSCFRAAVKELRKLDHDYAEFGVFKSFMYTIQDDRKKRRVA